MQACTTASGAVAFIDDRIERKDCSKSYKDLMKKQQENTKEEKPKAWCFFGRRKKSDISKAA